VIEIDFGIAAGAKLESKALEVVEAEITEQCGISRSCPIAKSKPPKGCDTGRLAESENGSLFVISDAAAQIADLGYEAHFRKRRRDGAWLTCRAPPQ
jgi:hypothetical protein